MNCPPGQRRGQVRDDRNSHGSPGHDHPEADILDKSLFPKSPAPDNPETGQAAQQDDQAGHQFTTDIAKQDHAKSILPHS